MPVDRGTLPRVDPRQVGAVGGRDRRADRTVALSYTGALTQTACWEGRSQVCDEIRLTLAEVKRRTPSAVPAWGPRGTTPRLTVRGTAAGAPPPPPLPLTHSPTHPLTHSPTHPLTHSPTHPLTHSTTHPLTHSPTHPLTHSPTHPLTHSPTHPLTHPPTHPLTHSPTHPITHSPTHPLTNSLVTWHQSKNPQDGSCRMDCLHALPRSTPIVNRRDSRATT